MKDVRRYIKKNECSLQTALIIGGSRGIGEVTAKMIAAAGGRTVITYHQNEDEASNVASNICKEGGICTVVKCDIKTPLKAIRQIAKKGIIVSHVYYFASPKIFNVKNGMFDTKLYNEFNRFYTDGFYKMYKACRKMWQNELCMFYPSTIAVDEKVKNLCEYTVAKAAGEALCSYLIAFDKKLRIVVRRLPRIATDQTVSIIKVPAANAALVMADIIRDCNSAFEKTPAEF
jgi:NAD(P)-dependent dehydrogenase (short-subunit alcohol dehydrogenase family)